MSSGTRSVPPADAGRVDAVGHGVARLAVVPGAAEGRPDVAEVADVAVVDRPHQLGRHEPADLVVAREVDVERHRAGADLGDRLVGVVERGDLDLDAVLLLERLHDRGTEVVGVVVEEERALLGLETVGDRLVVVGDVPRDGVVRRGDLDGLTSPATAGAGRRVGARLQQGAQGGHRDAQQSGVAQQRAPVERRARRLLHDTSADFGCCGPSSPSHKLNTQSIVSDAEPKGPS